MIAALQVVPPQKVFSLQRGDLIRRSCRLVGPQFCNFSKRGFESKNIKLSNTTKLILLDSLLQEVTEGEIRITTCLIRPSLYCLIHLSKRLSFKKRGLQEFTAGLCMNVLVQYGGRICLSEDSELVGIRLKKICDLLTQTIKFCCGNIFLTFCFDFHYSWSFFYFIFFLPNWAIFGVVIRFRNFF